MITHTPYFIKSQLKKPVQTRVRTSIPTFLVKTYELLENQDHKDIVCWSDDGKSFLIKKHNEFRDQVLPQYFKHNNFASFVRQLNMYDFHKVRNETTDSEYKNALFQKGQQKMLSEIKRKGGDNPNDEFQNLQGENNDDSSQLNQNPLNIANKQNTDELFDNSYILSELATLKQNQSNLEKAMKVLINQHETLIRENKLLWEEIQRQSEQDDLRSEKIMMVLAFFINRNNQNSNNNSQNQNQRQIALQQLSNRRNKPAHFEDIKQFLYGQTDKNQNIKQDDFSSLIKDISQLNNGQFIFDKNENKNNMQLFPLPINKKQQNEINPYQKSIKKLLEQYSSSDPNNKELIEQYLQSVINSGAKPMENKTSYLPIENISSTNSSLIKQEKPPISSFENGLTKKVCQDSTKSLKQLNSSEPSNALVKYQNNNNAISLNTNNKQMIPIPFKKEFQQSLKNTAQNKIPSSHSIDFNFDNTNNTNNIFKDTQFITQNLNNIGNNFPLLNLSRDNSANYAAGNSNDKFEKLMMDNNQGFNMRYSSSPHRIPTNDTLINPFRQTSIGDINSSPYTYYGQPGSFTPEHNFGGEEEAYQIRSRLPSFDKQNNESQSNHNFPSID